MEVGRSGLRFAPVILAGGSGTRFWPRSRKAKAKQVLALDGEQTMIQQTLDRLSPLASPADVWVITNHLLDETIAEQLPKVPREHILSEPAARNTAPACALAAFLLERSEPETVIGVSLWQSFGYNVIVLSAGLGGIPKEILEASRMDGTNAWQRLRSIILPMISPSLFFTMTMTMIGAFQVFVQPQILTQGGPGEATNTFVLYLYRNGFVFDRLGYASALAWMLFIVVMLITALQFAGQKRWVNYDK